MVKLQICLLEKIACQWSPSESFTGKAQLFDQTYTATFAPARSLYQKGRCTLLDDRELGKHGSKTEQVQVETRFKGWSKTCLVVSLLMRYIADSIRHIQSLRTAMVLMPWNKASLNPKPPAQATASSCLPGEIQRQRGLSSGSGTGRSRAWEKSSIQPKNTWNSDGSKIELCNATHVAHVYSILVRHQPTIWLAKEPSTPKPRM